MRLAGIHHVTAIASDPAANAAFYTEVVGMRLVKKTVNFDDPSTYHLYYGDGTGTPGTILTFFPWPNARRGTPGVGQVTAFAFQVPTGSLSFWRKHLESAGLAIADERTRFGEKFMQLRIRMSSYWSLLKRRTPLQWFALVARYRRRRTRHATLAEAILPGAGIVSPRGQVIENGAPRFFRRFAEGVLDVEDWREGSEALADFVTSICAEHEIPQRLCSRPATRTERI